MGYRRRLKSLLGELPLTHHQAERLGVEAHTQLSPALELCCLRVSANVSYQQAAEDVELFTGVRVSATTQQRLVHRQTFPRPELEQPVAELSVDGGKIRLRTPLGEPCIWKEYKGVCLHDQARGAWFQDNEGLAEWVNQPPLANPLTCLGDGHEGVWKVIEQVSTPSQRREILDWCHLVENLHKVDASPQRLQQAETLLWQGQVEATIALFTDGRHAQARNFCAYLERHRNRIVNYEYYHTEQLCSIGSGAVESTVKQIDRRTKISGAQWKENNVPQVLAHRCAYLNGSLRL